MCLLVRRTAFVPYRYTWVRPQATGRYDVTAVRRLWQCEINSDKTRYSTGTAGTGGMWVWVSECLHVRHCSWALSFGYAWCRKPIPGMIPGKQRKCNTTTFAQHLRGWSSARGSTCGTNGRPTPAQQSNSSRQEEISNHSNHSNPVIHDIGRGTVNN